MEFIKSIHSYWAYFTIFMVAIALVRVARLFFSQSNLKASDRKVPLFALIVTHLQFFLGLILYVLSPVVQQGLKNMGSAMKDPAVRLYVIEHPVMMILAIAFLTIGFKTNKKEIVGRREIKLEATLIVFFCIYFYFG